MKNNIGLLLSKRASLHPAKEAVIDISSGRRLTYFELNDASNRLANALSHRNVSKGTRVAILGMNTVEFVVGYFALAKIGAVMVPLNWRLVADELEFILSDSGASVLLFDVEFSDTVRELHERADRICVKSWICMGASSSVPDFSPSYSELTGHADTREVRVMAGEDDVLYIVYTSGTTGAPKGAVHTHDSAFWAALTVATTILYREDDRYLLSLPLYHVGALTPLTICIHTGITCVLARTFDPVATWQTIEREKITTMLAVPSMLNAMLQTLEKGTYDMSSLRWCMCGTAPVPVTLIETCNRLSIDILQTYGLTECGGPACVLNTEFAVDRAGSTGKAFLHTTVRVVDEQMNDVGTNEPGEVIVSGKHIMKEYWNRPEATAEAIVDGWLKTGDIAEADEEGFIYIKDRLKDMIISGGENIYPAELENVLLSHPDVKDVAVIGQSSDKWGESPLAVVVQKDDALTREDIITWCSGRMARYKQPKTVEFIDEIPRNPSGKALKTVLRKQFPGPAPE